jgi:DNA-binding beta-propeller fold protein YncE
MKSSKIWRQQSLRGLLCATFAAAAACCQAAPLTWTTAYNQTSSLRNQLRAVEVADQPGNNSVYAGFIQTTGGNRDVLRFDTDNPYTLLGNRGASNDQPKAIATDSRGYVYVGNRYSGGANAFIASYGPNFEAPLDSLDVAANQFGGLATAEFGGKVYLYASRETGNQILRYDATDPTNLVIDPTFGAGGVYTLGVGNGVLRGLEVANDGTIFVTNRDNGALYRISADLLTVTAAAANRAMDVALYGGKAYVTNYAGTNSAISVFDQNTLALLETITITTLDAAPYSRGNNEGWSGIDIGPDGRIWLGDQSYLTGSGGVVYDRLLVSSPIPEPSTWILATLGLATLLVIRRRKTAE